MEQRAKQLLCWFEPFVKLRAPKMFNLRRDPFERADENSNTYSGPGWLRSATDKLSASLCIFGQSGG